MCLAQNKGGSFVPNQRGLKKIRSAHLFECLGFCFFFPASMIFVEGKSNVTFTKSEEHTTLKKKLSVVRIYKDLMAVSLITNIVNNTPIILFNEGPGELLTSLQQGRRQGKKHRRRGGNNNKYLLLL